MHVSRNVAAVATLIDKDYRLGAVNLEQNWCFDGQKITQSSQPKVWTSSAGGGKMTIRWHLDPAQNIDKDPQNGGYWTREVVVTGSVEQCVLKYGCIAEIPFKLDLYVFGDGVTHNAETGLIK